MLTRIVPIQIIRRSLTAKLLLAFGVIILVGIGGVAVLANLRTTAAFEHYLRAGRPDPTRMVGVVAALYRETNSLNAAGTVLSAVPLPPDQEALLADSSGRIVADTGGTQVGKSATSAGLTDGTPVTVNGQVIGKLYLLDFGDAYHDGSNSVGNGGGATSGLEDLFSSPRSGLGADDAAFLSQVDESLVVAAVGAIAVALLLAVLLARQIIRPLRQLTRVAQRITHGHLDERIAVSGDDEVSQLANAFNEMAESLARTEAARRQLVADIAHELRTPLTVIGGTVQAMRDGVLPTDEVNLVTIQEEVTSLARLVSDLRDLSLGDVGQFPIEHEPVDLASVAESVGSAFAAEAAANGVELTVDLPAGLPGVLGDETRLRQCVRNLVDNALRHTPPGGSVVIRGRRAPHGVTIDVSDSGEGIKPENLPHLFDRFYRADESRNRRSGGSGLGLAIVQQIILAHGGQVGVSSPGPGRGATFTMYLPQAPPLLVDRPLRARA